jgi:septal ring factor EnvC (AmiA/AmiB activator)
MPACKALRLVIFFWLILLILGNPPAAGVPEKPAPVPAKGMATPVASPETLPRVLSQEAEALEKDTGAVKSRVVAAQKDLAQGEKNNQEGKAAAAVFQASLAVKGLSLSQVTEALDSYSQQQGRIDKRLSDMGQEIKTLKKEQAAKEAVQTRLQRHP